ncbi:MAG TPA: hypothetical protein PK619_01820 [bacterium]|nr:hypothetical protein [bacterium]HPW39436.1 hypothetical protein [bacterium]
MIILNKKLRDRIILMAKIDQEAREAAVKDYSNKKLSRKAYLIDGRNIVKVKKIIKDFGWPTYDLVGRRASNAFWLLVQHADRDLAFQKKCLKLLEIAVRDNQAKPINLAYLTDRVRIAEGKKQMFGTQYRIKDGKLVLKPVIDRKNLDKLRKKYGMTTMKQQNKKMSVEYKSILKKCLSE